MSDYARANSGGATHFTDKDGLSTGDPNKVIVGAEHDSEFEAIKTAANSKFDSDDIASQAEAEAATSNLKLMTPLRTEQWVDVWGAENGGMIANIQALADPGADVLLGWDESANDVIGFTLGAGLLHAATALSVDHDAATNFVADEHIAHGGVTITAGTGMTGGGTIAATRTLNVIGGSGITANANDIAITNVAAGAAQPVVITAGTFTFDLASITELTMPNFSQSADKILVSDAGVLKVMPYDEAGIKVASVSGTADTLTAADMNTLIEYTNAGAVTVTLNDSVGVQGNIVVIKQTGAGQVTINGTADVQAALGQSTRTVDSVITLVCLVDGATAEWALYGDSVA